MEPILVLNADYTPFDIWGWKKAMKKWLGENSVNVIEFQNVEITSGGNKKWLVPSVLILIEYITTFNKLAPYNKTNVYARDKLICQYCQKHIKYADLTLDHVIPKDIWKKRKMLGSYSIYTNVVTCCKPCNLFKNNRTPQQAGLKLLKQPKNITRGQAFAYKLALLKMPPHWRQYINYVTPKT